MKRFATGLAAMILWSAVGCGETGNVPTVVKGQTSVEGGQVPEAKAPGTAGPGNKKTLGPATAD